MDGLKATKSRGASKLHPTLQDGLNVLPMAAVVHIDTATTRSGLMRPAAGLGGALPVAGLFLGGAGSHPGGGVNGLPGRIAAGRAARFLAR